MMKNAFFAAVLLTITGPLAAGTVHLRSEAKCPGPQVKLSDVAELEGDAAAFADAVVGEFAGSGGELRLGISRVRQVLDERKANWGMLSLRGPVEIRVVREAKPVKKPTPVAAMDATGTAVANPVRPVSIYGEVAAAGWALPQETAVETVADRLRRWICDQLGASGADVGIDFQENPLLNEPASGERLEFEPLSRSFLGRLPVQVRRYAADGRLRSDHVVAQVRQRMQVVVATRSLGRGSILEAGDVQLREIWLNASTANAIASLDQAVGRKLRGAVTTGSLVQVDDLEEALAIRRGQMVTVRCLSGGLVLRMTARAMESGEVGQWIQLKNEQNRQLFQARVSGTQEAVIVMESLAVQDTEERR